MRDNQSGRLESANKDLAQLITNPIQQKGTLASGIEYILDLTCRWSLLQEAYRDLTSDQSCGSPRRSKVIRQFTANLTQLYAHVIEFQAKVVRHVNAGAALRTARGVIKWDEWESMVKKIKELEGFCKRNLDALEPGKLDAGLKAFDTKMANKLSEIIDVSKKTLQQAKDTNQNQIDRESEWEQNQCIKDFCTAPYEEHKDRNEKPMPGTCEWVTAHKVFINWCQKQDLGVLWINGVAGCGKSVLIKHVVDNVMPSTAIRMTCYYFFKDEDTTRRSIEHALCALLHQMFKRKGILVRHAIRDWKMDGTQLFGSFTKLWNILKLVSEDPSAGEIVCLLDALDECDDYGRNRLIKALGELQDTKIQFLVTSRPYGTIELCMRKCLTNPPMTQIVGEDESIASEILLFIDNRLDELESDGVLPVSKRPALRKALVTTQNRTYLWIVVMLGLVEDDLRDTDAFESTIGKLPESIEDAYEKMLNRCKRDDRPRVEKMLQIIVGAVRPLTLAEMNTALKVDDASSRATDLRCYRPESVTRMLKDLCGLFVSIFYGKVYLLHQTAREFLLTRIDPAYPFDHDATGKKWQGSLTLQQSHLTLAKICVTYLRLPEFALDWRTVIRDDHLRQHDGLKLEFGEYSTYHWMKHFHGCDSAGRDEIAKSAQHLFQTGSSRFMNWYRAFAWYQGLVTARSFSNSKFIENHGIGLLAAVRWRLIEVIPLIVESGSDPIDSEDGDGCSVISMAVEKDHKEILTVLLDRGLCPTNTVDSEGRTALYHAARRDRAEIARMFLDRSDIEPNMADCEGWTPLHHATRHNQLEIARMLIDRSDVELNMADFEGWTPLHHATRHNQLEIARMLIDCSDVEPNTADSEGWTPLHYAARHGRLEIARMLVNRSDIEIDAEDKDHCTPLSVAFTRPREKNVDIVKYRLDVLHFTSLLLDQNASQNGGSSCTSSPLFLAIRKRQPWQISVLLNIGASFEKWENLPAGYAIECPSYKRMIHLRKSIKDVMLIRMFESNAYTEEYKETLKLLNERGLSAEVGPFAKRSIYEFPTEKHDGHSENTAFHAAIVAGLEDAALAAMKTIYESFSLP